MTANPIPLRLMNPHISHSSTLPLRLAATLALVLAATTAFSAWARRTEADATKWWHWSMS